MNIIEQTQGLLAVAEELNDQRRKLMEFGHWLQSAAEADPVLVDALSRFEDAMGDGVNLHEMRGHDISFTTAANPLRSL